jgi:hypothetical protein
MPEGWPTSFSSANNTKRFWSMKDLVGLSDIYIDVWHQFSLVKDYEHQYAMFMETSKDI